MAEAEEQGDVVREELLGVIEDIVAIYEGDTIDVIEKCLF